MLLVIDFDIKSVKYSRFSSIIVVLQMIAVIHLQVCSA